MQDQAGSPSRGVGADFDLAPGHIADATAQRFCHRFFTSETRSQAMGFVGAVLPFAGGKETAKKTFAAAFDPGRDARALDHIHATANHQQMPASLLAR